jgi:heptosyltransferase-1
MKIAIVKLTSLGDIVLCMAGLQFIKNRHPDMQIDWVVDGSFAEILRYNPDIDNILPVNIRHLKAGKTAIYPEIKRLGTYAKNSYDMVIDAQGLIKSAICARLISKHCAGFHQDSVREKPAAFFYEFKTSIPFHANTVLRNIRVLTEPLDISVTKEQILAKKPFLFFKNENPVIYDYLQQDGINIIFVAGSTSESRIYPADRFINIANALKQNCLVVWGTEEEKQKADDMASQSEWITAMPKLDLNSLKALVARANLVIGNDTGPTHFAWALNRPSITIFGSTPVSRVYQTEINKTVKSSSVVNPYKLNKNDFSIRDINEEEILVLARQLLFLQ